MNRENKIYYTAIIVIVTLFLLKMCWYSQRAVPYYEADIRNKVVGARLQMDGYSPYFYHWKRGDSIRYYDCNAQDFEPSMCTSSPFQSMLYYPIANLPQATINGIWNIVLNVIFIAIILLILSFTKKRGQVILVLLSGLLFYYSQGWKMNLKNGQNYILIPFGVLLFLYFINKANTVLNGFICGITASAIILFKPVIILIFLPLILLAGRYKKKYIGALLSGALAVLIFTFYQPHAMSLWKDYFKSINTHVKIWQEPHEKLFEKPPLLDQWEGINVATTKKKDLKSPLNLDNESSSFFLFYNSQSRSRAPLWLLYFLFVMGSIVLCILFYLRIVMKKKQTILNLVLLGFCLYFTSEFFSPIGRSIYYSIQWIFPALMVLAFYSRKNSYSLLLITAGLLLNVIAIWQIKYEHTLGEILLFAGVYLFAITVPEDSNYTTNKEINATVA